MPVKSRYAKLRQANACPGCGIQHDGPTTYCGACLDKARQKYQKEEVYCVDCGADISALKVTNRSLRCTECKRKKQQTYHRTFVKKLTPMEKAIRRIQDTERARKRREQNPTRILDLTYKRLYGLSFDAVAALHVKQNGKCAICEKGLPPIDSVGEIRKQMHLDHCHKTGAVRGLLCPSCNLAIGLFKDSVDIMRKAIVYLEHAASST